MTMPSSAATIVTRRAALAAALSLAACVPKLPGQGPAPRTFRVTPKYTFDPDLPKAKALQTASRRRESTLPPLRRPV